MTGHKSAIPRLGPDRAPWLFDEGLQTVLAVLNRDGAVTRVVGGAVRNTLIDMPVSDIDLATTLPPEQVIALGRASGLTVVETGLEHGTVTIVAGPRDARLVVEVTTLRADVETHGRRATVAFTEDWAGDAARRDFTINALYCDADGTVYDPFGGIRDIESRTIRFIGDPAARIAEDYLRILRFFRFTAQYGAGAADGAGLAACVAAQDGLAQLSAERIRQELFKLLAAGGAVTALKIMDETGILARICGPHTDVDSFTRLVEIECGQGCQPDPLLRLATLVPVGRTPAGDQQERLRLSRAQTGRLDDIASTVPVPDPSLGDLECKALLYRAGPELFRDIVLIAWANSTAPVADEGWTGLLSLPARWTAPRFPVSGRDVIAAGVPKGPRVGRLLREVEQRWIDGGFAADRQDLLACLQILL